MNEKMEDFKDGYTWFGTYEISTKIVDNNN